MDPHAPGTTGTGIDGQQNDGTGANQGPASDPTKTLTNHGTVHSTQEEDVPPLMLMQNGSSNKYKVDVKTVNLDGDLRSTVQALIATINEVEGDSASPKLVYYDNGAIHINGMSQGTEGIVPVPENINNAHLAKHYLDMDMLGNYVNLYIDHIYFFRSHNAANEVAKDDISQHAVRDIIAKLSSTFDDLKHDVPSQDGVLKLDDVLEKIVRKIEAHYPHECNTLFDKCADLKTFINQDLKLSDKHRTKTFLAVFIHYILSRMLVLKFSQRDTKDTVLNEIRKKTAVIAPTHAPPATAMTTHQGSGTMAAATPFA